MILSLHNTTPGFIFVFTRCPCLIASILKLEDMNNVDPIVCKLDLLVFYWFRLKISRISNNLMTKKNLCQIMVCKISMNFVQSNILLHNYDSS